MNLLTQSLLKELLGEQKTVAIYGGGFKPPTKGHFRVAELTLEKFPEIDELKIFVGGGVRDGITQDESIKIWNIYKNYLSPKVDVEASVAPVKSVLGYAKENLDTKVYWILGARDGDEADLADIENRTKSISKYPNLEVKVITTSGGVSGTKTRQAVRDNNKEQFFHLIPDVNDTEKEEIWNMISPIIKEGIVDNMKIKIKDFISAIKQEGQETKEVVGLLIHAAQGKIKLNDEQKEYIGNQLKDVLKLIGLTAIAVLPGGSIAAVLLKVFKQTHLITPSSMMNELVTDTEVICDNCGWEWPIADGGDDLYTCHKCGHDNNPDLDEASNPQAGTALPYGSGFAPVNEVDLKSTEQKINNLPQGKLFDDAKNIESIFNKSRHSWSETIESFEKNKDKSEEQNIDIKDIHITQPNIQSNKVKNMITNIDKLPIINVVEFADGEKVIHDGHHRLIVNWALGNTKIKVNLIKVDELKENDPFGIKAYARELVKEVFDKTWNLQEGMLSLSRYMIDNGMNIKPLPKIKVIKDDEENASNLLGKTAYYNPVEKSITLFTMNRHPKDILRSFAHEMIHHEQNLNGKLNNITTQNTNEDGDLPEIEREAYEKGNMMLRNWEDSIKNV
jgi:nicotinamide mononucleotide adenylyltransferase